MAVDEALLASAAENDLMTLRFYGWSEPTLSLGYFQPYAARAEHSASRACAVVRRSSGGGAIVHDAELTYSLAIPRTSRFARDAMSAYGAAHGALVDTLCKLGADATLWSEPSLHRGDESFLCFRRRSVGDVMLRNAKIAGSAQRRYRGAILQHGSVILQRSASAPGLAGLDELGDIDLSIDTLAAAWRPFVEKSLDVELIPDELTPAEQTHASQLVVSKHTCAEWIERR